MKKRVLIVAPYNNGTIGLCSLNLYQAFKENDKCIVRCVVVHKYNDGHSGLEECSFCQGNKKSGLKRLFSIFNQIVWLKKIKKEFKPDITISTLSGCSTLNVLSGGHDKKIGVFHAPHTQSKKNGLISYIVVLLTYTFIYPFLDKLCCVSKEVKSSIESTFPTISKKKISVIYNVHNIDEIRRKSSIGFEDVNENEIFKNPVILYCGRLDHNKSPERLLLAFAKSNISSNCQLVYIGSDTDNLWHKLYSLSQDLGIDQRVHYLGRKSNPYPYFSKANVLVSCSKSEGLPGVLVEALILGKPVISTNASCGVWEILSCDADYDRNLNSIYICNNGVISSNVADEDTNVSNLASSIETIFEKEFSIRSPFLSEVNGKDITNKFLAL